jgi:hypothetical protein
MDWGDWAEDYEADGGAGFTYDLYVNGSAISETNENDVENGTDNDTFEQAKAAYDMAEADPDSGTGYSWYMDPWAGSILFSPGDIGEDGDVDTLVNDFDDPKICQWSFYPGVNTELSPQLSLYNDAYELVAQTTDPDITPEYNFLYNAGITYPVPTAGTYYLQIEDTTGTSGLDHWYPALFACYDAEVATFDAEIYSTNPAQGNLVNMTESTNTADYFYGRMVGFLDDGDDTVDYFILDEGVDAGDYVNVQLEVADAGSLLVDPFVTVIAKDGATILTTITGEANPTIKDLEVPDEGGPLYISIESETGLSGTGAYYLGLASAYTEPQGDDE